MLRPVPNAPYVTYYALAQQTAEYEGQPVASVVAAGRSKFSGTEFNKMRDVVFSSSWPRRSAHAGIDQREVERGEQDRGADPGCGLHRRLGGLLDRLVEIGRGIEGIELLGDRDLEVVPGIRLVKRRRFNAAGAALLLRLVGVDEVRARPAAGGAERRAVRPPRAVSRAPSDSGPLDRGPLGGDGDDRAPWRARTAPGFQVVSAVASASSGCTRSSAPAVSAASVTIVRYAPSVSAWSASDSALRRLMSAPRDPRSAYATTMRPAGMRSATSNVASKLSGCPAVSSSTVRPPRS